LCYQLNVEVFGDGEIVISLLVSNIAKGNESHMRAMLAILEGRVKHHQIVGPGGSSTYGLCESRASDMRLPDDVQLYPKQKPRSTAWEARSLRRWEISLPRR
jgi:hypothetical protein